MTTQFLERFSATLAPVAAFIEGRQLDDDLEKDLNQRFPDDDETFRAVADACRDGIAAGVLCGREAGGIKYGRALPPGDDLAGCSVDVVYMKDVVGPQHTHPNGEIDMVVPLTETARFDGSGAGWVVYGPGSQHAPTVTGGDAIVLYLLPGGAIEFSRAKQNDQRNDKQ